MKLSENQWYQIAAVVRPWSRSVSFYVDGTIVENAKIMDDLDFFEDCTKEDGSRICIGKRVSPDDDIPEIMPKLSRDASVEVGTFMALATNESEEEEDEEEKARREKEIEEQRREDQVFEGKIANLVVYSRALSERKLLSLVAMEKEEKTEEQTTTILQFEQPTCSKGHALVLGANVGKYSGSRFYCDVCRASGDLPVGYSCAACKYDLCKSCFQREQSKLRLSDPRFLMLEARHVLGDAIWTLQRALALEVFSCSVSTQVSSQLAKSLLAPMKSHLSVLLEQRNDVSSSVYGLEAVVVLLKVIRCPVAQRELSSEEWCELLLRHSIYFDDKEDANSVIQRLCIRVMRLSNIVFSKEDLHQISSLVMPLYLDMGLCNPEISHEVVQLLHTTSLKKLSLENVASKVERVHDELIGLATTKGTNDSKVLHVFGNIVGMTRTLEASVLECFAMLAVISKHWKSRTSIDTISSSLIRMLLISLRTLSTKETRAVGPALYLALRLRVASLQTVASVLETCNDAAETIMRTKLGRAVVASLAECSLSCPVRFNDEKKMKPWSLKWDTSITVEETKLASRVCEEMKMKSTSLALRSIRETCRDDDDEENVVKRSVKWLQDLSSEEIGTLKKLHVGFGTRKQRDVSVATKKKTKEDLKKCWDTRLLRWYHVNSAWTFRSGIEEEELKQSSTYVFEYSKKRDAFDVKRRKKSGIPKLVTIGSMITTCGESKKGFVMIPSKKNKKQKKCSSERCEFVCFYSVFPYLSNTYLSNNRYNWQTVEVGYP